MLEIILLLLIGLIIASLWDLKTTEVPDEIPYLLIIVGIFYWLIIGSASNDFTNLFYSLTIGSLLLAFGLLLYKLGKWGGADAWLLAAIGYTIPLHNNQIFMAGFILNFLVVATAYTVIYTLIIGLMNRESFSYLREDLRRNYKIFFIPLAFLSFPVYLYSRGVFLTSSLIPSVSIFLLLIFWRFAVNIERKIFTRKISSSKIKEGDVLEEMVWRGLTDQEVERIKKNRKYVTIKEGIRFVPVFPITLVVTLIYGTLFCSLIPIQVLCYF